MSAGDKARILAAVAISLLSKSQALAELGIPRRTYYNWIRQQREGRVKGGNRKSRVPWNRLRAEEEEAIVAEALASS